MAGQISFERPFKYVFQDKDWVKKVLIGGLVVLSCCVLVGLPVLMGYQKKLFLTLSKDENAPVPDVDFGKDLGEGLGPLGAAFLYAIAVSIISAIPILGWLLGPILGLALAVWMPVALMRYYTTGVFGSVFEFNWIIEFIKRNISNLLLMFVVSLVTGIVAQAGVLACGIGVLFTAFWAMLANGVAMADVWRFADQPGAAPAEPPPATTGPNPAP